MWDVRYRPLKFADVLGQEGSVEVLKSRLRKGTGLETSYIFSGGHGQGKTTLARILARALLCLDLQDGEPCNKCTNCLDILNEASAGFTEMDAASKGTIDVARGIVDDLPFVVQDVAKRIYLFDEAHRMSRDAQDVLLKPLEDKRLVGIFCTTEPEKIRGPIRSRCEEYPIRKVTREDIFRRMAWVLGQENVTFEEDAVMTVIDYSQGHVRDILNRLEMIAQLGPITQDSVRDHLKLSVVSTYYDILLFLGDPASAVRLVEAACDEMDPGDIATGIAEAAMNSFRLANGMHADFSLVDRERAKKVYEMYGANITSLAEYFLQDYRPTKISLISNVVRCCSSKSAPKAPVLASGPPVLVQAPQALQATPQAPSLPLQTSPQALQVPQQAPSPPAEEVPPVSSTSASLTVLQAPVDMTDIERNVMGGDLPRGHRETKGPGNKPQAASCNFISAEDWRREFETLYFHHQRKPV